MLMLASVAQKNICRYDFVLAFSTGECTSTVSSLSSHYLIITEAIIFKIKQTHEYILENKEGELVLNIARKRYSCQNSITQVITFLLLCYAETRGHAKSLGLLTFLAN